MEYEGGKRYTVVTVKALKRALKKAGLKTSGKKATLTRRARKARLMRGGDDDSNMTNVPQNVPPPNPNNPMVNVPPPKQKKDGGYTVDCDQPENREQPECKKGGRRRKH